MDFWRILKLFQLSVEAQQTSSPIVAWGAVTLILAIAIWLLAAVYAARRRRKLETLEQLEQWSRVGEQRRFFEDLRNRPVAARPVESAATNDQKATPGKDQPGAAASSSVSELLLILISDEAAPKTSPGVRAPAPRKTAS